MSAMWTFAGDTGVPANTDAVGPVLRADVEDSRVSPNLEVLEKDPRPFGARFAANVIDERGHHPSRRLPGARHRSESDEMLTRWRAPEHRVLSGLD